MKSQLDYVFSKSTYKISNNDISYFIQKSNPSFVWNKKKISHLKLVPLKNTYSNSIKLKE